MHREAVRESAKLKGAEVIFDLGLHDGLRQIVEKGLSIDSVKRQWLQLIGDDADFTVDQVMGPDEAIFSSR